ncbi:Mediator of RNA polymerase II transcription subunit [Trichinella pseudospiralis]
MLSCLIWYELSSTIRSTRTPAVSLFTIIIRHPLPAMGISWVYLYSDPEKSDRQDLLLDSLQTALNNMDAKQTGFFTITSETFFSTSTTNTKPVHLFQSSEFPETTFVLVGDTLGSASTFLFAEKSITQMIRNLDGAYCTKPISKVECRGNKYVISDFTVRTSVATIASNFKGILVEVEYRPCIVMQLCGDLMKEFCTALLGTAASGPPTFAGLTKPNQRYVPIDTIFHNNNNNNNSNNNHNSNSNNNNSEIKTHFVRSNQATADQF